MNVQDHLEPFGLTRCTIKNWTKQADCCWSPTSSTDTMPSLVVEVGLSESTRQLALSARHWLETLSSVGIMVTITINCKRPEIILHRWELGSLAYGERTMTFVTGESGMDVSTITTTTQLELPFGKLLACAPCQPLERCLVTPEQKLRCFAEDIWRAQGLL